MEVCVRSPFLRNISFFWTVSLLVNYYWAKITLLAGDSFLYSGCSEFNQALRCYFVSGTVAISKEGVEILKCFLTTGLRWVCFPAADIYRERSTDHPNGCERAQIGRTDNSNRNNYTVSDQVLLSQANSNKSTSIAGNCASFIYWFCFMFLLQK